MRRWASTSIHLYAIAGTAAGAEIITRLDVALLLAGWMAGWVGCDGLALLCPAADIASLHPHQNQPGTDRSIIRIFATGKKSRKDLHIV